MTSTEPTLWTEDGREDLGDRLPGISSPEAQALAIAELADRARSYARNSKAANTIKAYESDLRHFGAWCASTAQEPLPASGDTVALYLAAHAGGLAVSTLRRRLAAISVAHQAANFENPTTSGAVKLVWGGIRRTHGRPPEAKEAATTDVVTAMIVGLGERLIDVRDRALILIGFAGAMLRSELRALDVGDITETSDGLVVTRRHSKVDQEGHGHSVGITYGSNPPTCPVRAWRAWVAAAALEDGPAFRVVRNGTLTDARLGDRTVARMLKRRAEKAGYNAEFVAGHSLRRGFATTAFRAGVAEHSIMRQGGWRSTAAMRGYIQEGEMFVGNPTAKLGL